MIIISQYWQHLTRGLQLTISDEGKVSIKQKCKNQREKKWTVGEKISSYG